jgi:hypothetical protein
MVWLMKMCLFFDNIRMQGHQAFVTKEGNSPSSSLAKKLEVKQHREAIRKYAEEFDKTNPEEAIWKVYIKTLKDREMFDHLVDYEIFFRCFQYGNIKNVFETSFLDEDTDTLIYARIIIAYLKVFHKVIDRNEVNSVMWTLRRFLNNDDMLFDLRLELHKVIITDNYRIHEGEFDSEFERYYQGFINKPMPK